MVAVAYSQPTENTTIQHHHATNRPQYRFTARLTPSPPNRCECELELRTHSSHVRNPHRVRAALGLLTSPTPSRTGGISRKFRTDSRVRQKLSPQLWGRLTVLRRSGNRPFCPKLVVGIDSGGFTSHGLGPAVAGQARAVAGCSHSLFSEVYTATTRWTSH